MPDARSEEIDRFLAAGPARGGLRRPLAGDASLRRYERVVMPDGATHVLMDAPPGSGEDVRPFTAIARWLTGNGFSAPHILAEDADAGLLLIEDLGDDLYFTLLAQGRADEPALYAAATDVLADLAQLPPPALAAYDTARMTDLAALAWRWYRMEVAGRAEPADARFRDTFALLLDAHAGPCDTVALRDFHAQNLIWLPARQGRARVGLLDFQDAMLGPAVYDLVSLITDARRDVPPDLARAMTERFAARTGADPDAIRAACAIVGLQRNLRILGVFARLSMHFARPHYVDLIPRVWAHVLRDLDHPAAAPVRSIILSDLPAPDPAHLDELKARCGTIPTR